MGIVSSPRRPLVSGALALQDLQPNPISKTHVLSRRMDRVIATPKMLLCLPFRLQSKSSISEARCPQRDLELALFCLLPIWAMRQKMMGCSTRQFVNLPMLEIEHDSTFYLVEGRCRAQMARTLVRSESPVAVVTLKAEAAKKPSRETGLELESVRCKLQVMQLLYCWLWCCAVRETRGDRGRR